MSSYEMVGEGRKNSRKPIVVGVLLMACVGLGAVAVWNGDEVKYNLETANNILRSWRCPPGGYASGPGRRGNCLCTKCPRGYKCPGGNHGKRACSPGQFQDTPGQNKCKPTPAGTYSPGSGASTPTPCQYGTYTKLTGQRACTKAKPGNHVPGRGAKSQTKCPPGKVQNLSGQRFCKPTPAGTYSPNHGQTSGTPCNYGSYQPSRGKTSCLPSPPGNYVPSTGQTKPTKCGTNTFQHCNGQTRCIPCETGLSAGRGATKCLAYNPNINGVKCIGAKGGYATIVAPKSGTISGITLTHQSGYVTHCVGHAACQGNFGTSHMGGALAIIITNNANTAKPPIMYPVRGTSGYGNNMDQFGFYTMSQYRGKPAQTAKKITFTNPRRSVTKLQKYRVYYSESYTRKTMQDNGGRMCFKTTYNYV